LAFGHPIAAPGHPVGACGHPIAAARHPIMSGAPWEPRGRPSRALKNWLPAAPMPRTYQPGVKPSPSGLPCRHCGATTSSGWRGINSRLCARTKTGCKDEAAAEAACQPWQPPPSQPAVPTAGCVPVAPALHVPRAVVVTALPLTAPVDGLPMAAPLVAVACAELLPERVATASAVPLVTPDTIGVPLAAPPVAVPPAVAPVAGAKRAAARVPLGEVNGNVQAAKRHAAAVRRAVPPATAVPAAAAAAPPAARGSVVSPVAAEPAAEQRGAGAADELSAYELQRQANIERNAAHLRGLGIHGAVEGLRAPPRPPPKPRAPPKPPPPTSRTMRSAAATVAARAPAAVPAAAHTRPPPPPPPAATVDKRLCAVLLELFAHRDERSVKTVCKETGVPYAQLRPQLNDLDILDMSRHADGSGCFAVVADDLEEWRARLSVMCHERALRP
jgi:hypothetical protein